MLWGGGGALGIAYAAWRGLWRGLLYCAVTLPVAAAVWSTLALRQAGRDVYGAVSAGVQLTHKEKTAEEDAEDAEFDQEDKTGSTTEAARGRGRAQSRRGEKATPVAGRRRRTNTARQQNKVWDPGR